VLQLVNASTHSSATLYTLQSMKHTAYSIININADATLEIL